MTAEQFYEYKRLAGETEDITGNPNPDYNNRFYSEIFELMTGFAKMHVTEALKKASEKAKQDHDYSISSQKFIPSGIDKESILNAYPLELIK